MSVSSIVRSTHGQRAGLLTLMATRQRVASANGNGVGAFGYTPERGLVKSAQLVVGPRGLELPTRGL